MHTYVLHEIVIGSIVVNLSTIITYLRIARAKVEHIMNDLLVMMKLWQMDAFL